MFFSLSLILSGDENEKIEDISHLADIQNYLYMQNLRGDREYFQ